MASKFNGLQDFFFYFKIQQLTMILCFCLKWTWTVNKSLVTTCTMNRFSLGN